MYISSLPKEEFYYGENEKQMQLEKIVRADKFSQCISAINKGKRLNYLETLHKDGLVTDQEYTDALNIIENLII